MNKSTQDMAEAFGKNVRFSYEYGNPWFECKKGLWAVSGPDLSKVTDEALHYFQQYWNDGEYDE